MALCMSFVISGVLTYINLGLVDGFVKIWLKGYAKAFVIAYPTLLVLTPFVTKLAKMICIDKSKVK
ncbi:DUF2798 domain-containing protein [Campylobacter californiensis]|nr:MULTISPECIES: DUF2798 domain-containing protein [unclassified Campylobacter]